MKVIRFISIFNVALCFLFTIYGTVQPEKIRGNLTGNQVGLLMGLCTEIVGLVLFFVLLIIFRDEGLNKLMNLTGINLGIYIVMIANLLWRLSTDINILEENGTTNTASKVMTSIAVAMGINWHIYVIVSNHFKRDMVNR